MPRPARRITHDRNTFAYASAHVRDDGFVGRRSITFTCPRGHAFMVPFADGIALPDRWECRQHGLMAELGAVPRERPPAKIRTHWDMLCERRPEADMVQLLNQQLKALRAGRLLPMEEWLRQSQERSRERRDAGLGMDIPPIVRPRI